MARITRGSPTYSAEQALEMLATLYSSEDPIVYDGREMEVRELENEVDGFGLKLAIEVSIQFFRCTDDCVRLSRGTLHSMVLDRMCAL